MLDNFSVYCLYETYCSSFGFVKGAHKNAHGSPERSGERFLVLFRLYKTLGIPTP